MPLATNGKIPRPWLKNGKLVLNGNVNIYYQCKTTPTSAINEHLTQGPGLRIYLKKTVDYKLPFLRL
jgi:hypothetical protein